MEIETEPSQQSYQTSSLIMNEDSSPPPVLPLILAEDDEDADVKSKESEDDGERKNGQPVSLTSLFTVHPPLQTKSEQKKEQSKKSSNATTTTTTTVVKRPRHNPSERRILLAKAVEDVKNQRISMRRAAQRYNLAKSSLCDYVRKQGIILPTVRYKNNSNANSGNNNNNTDYSSNNTNTISTNNIHTMDNKLPTQVPSLTNNLMSHLSPLNTGLFSNTNNNHNNNITSSTSQPDFKKIKLDTGHPNSFCNGIGGGSHQLPAHQAGSLLSPFHLVTSNRNLNHLLLTNQNFQGHNSTVINQNNNPLTPVNNNTASNNNNNLLSSMLVNLLNNQTLMNNQMRTICPFPTMPTSFPGQNYAADVNNLLMNFQQRIIAKESQRCLTPSVINDTSSNVVNDMILTNFVDIPETPEKIVHDSQEDSQCSTPKSTEIDSLRQKDSASILMKGKQQPSIYFDADSNSKTATSGSGLVQLNFDSSSTINCDNNIFNNNNNDLNNSIFSSKTLKSTMTPSRTTTKRASTTPTLLLNPEAAVVHAASSLLNPLVDSQVNLAALLSSTSSAANSVFQHDGQQLFENNAAVLDQLISNSTTLNDRISSGGDDVGKRRSLVQKNLKNSLSFNHLSMGNNNNNNNSITTNSNIINNQFGIDDDVKPLYHLNIFQPSSQAYSSLMMNSLVNHQQLQKAKELVQFINNSPTPFHVVRTVKDRLTASGFRELKDTETNWNLKANDKFFVTKNGSTLFAVAVGGAYKPDSGFSIFGAHTDSPCLRVKPNSTRISQGTVQLGVETYGGGLWYTWLDRDLTLAGRCIIKKEDDESLIQKLVNFERPVACVPSLAIHLNRDQNKSFSPSFENHLVPILCTEANSQLNQTESLNETDFENRHPLELVNALAVKLDCQPKDIVECELYLVDSQPATIGGLNNEFIHAPRLDNQFNCYVGTEGFLGALKTLEQDENVRVLCLYDHEEVGSTSCQGANSSYTANLLRRIHANLNGSQCDHNNFCAAMGKSLLISADQAHAIHPSHPERHEKNHQPKLHSRAVVVKNNVNQRYTTNSLTSAIIRSLASREKVEIINFVINQDSSCGSTIGPMLSSQLGIHSIDTGSAQVAMHSCRELAGVSSICPAIDLYKSFFDNLSTVMKSLKSEM